MRSRILSFIAVIALASNTAGSAAQSIPLGSGWLTYGGDSGGTRFSNSSQITKSTVARLHMVWTFHTHALDQFKDRPLTFGFEATPILSRDSLFFTSPYDVVFALDARTGLERWRFDPAVEI